MARFFIDRPIFAWVIAILTMLAGSLSLVRLPVAQYPAIAASEVTISAMYPGASAKTVEDTVTQVIEQQMKGIDNLMYMYSTSNSFGQATVNFAFEAGTDIDIAQVQVQNKLQLAMPLLPDLVQRQGIAVEKSMKNYLLITSFISPDGSMQDTDIGNYVASNIVDPIGRLPGVGQTTLFGAQYAMRVWMDPEKLEKYGLNPVDIIEAIGEQNEQVSGGQVGAAPALPGQPVNVSVNASSRLESVEQFENILVRVNEDGSTVFLRDVARVELNNDQFMTFATHNGMPAAGLAVKLASGANALETVTAIKAELAALSTFFPAGLEYEFSYDTGPIVSESISSVFKTLIEAVILVFLVMFLFLQNFRATLIPTIAIPVVLLGTFGVLAAVGFSINTLTMFGMVLAIGLLVDDAIVVVENVERLMHEEGLSPKEAARKSMDQITGALVGVAVVIAAVFVPMAFMVGSTGVIYRQFSITIVTAMTLSVAVAVILTPAMCATMLRHKTPQIGRGVFGRFNVWFERLTNAYQRTVGRLIRKPGRHLAVFAASLVLAGVLFSQLPTGFLPDEDQGLLAVVVQTPPGATFEQTETVLKEIDEYFRTEETTAVKSSMTVSGLHFGGTGQNMGMSIAMLKDWQERPGKDQSVFAIMERVRARFENHPGGAVFAFVPPAVLELGNSMGFDFELIDRGGRGHAALMEARNILLAEAAKNPALRNVRPNGMDDVEQYELDIDLAKAGAQGLRKRDINSAIAAYWGSVYVNDFMDRGRTKKVYVQADTPFRMQSSDFNRYYVRNKKSEMVPFSSFLSVHSTQGSPQLERYDGLSSIEILGEAAPGYSTGQAMAVMEDLVRSHLPGFDCAWTGISYQEAQAGSQAPMLYALSLAVVFLCLAALYESWTVPMSVLLVVPWGVLGALAGVYLRGMNNDVYLQVGLLTVVGLAAKNSILIVEFAKAMHEQGRDILEATMEAVKLRLRPIIMTTLCFVLGVMPLMLGSGAGSGGQNALGTTVVFGVTTAMVLGIFFTPIFFVVVNRLFSRRSVTTEEDIQNETSTDRPTSVDQI